MENVELVGNLAAILTTGAYAPQAYKVFKTQETHSISIVTLIVLNAGIFLWMVFGILTEQQPLIWSNVLTMVMSGYILFVKAKNMRMGNE